LSLVGQVAKNTSHTNYLLIVPGSQWPRAKFDWLSRAFAEDWHNLPFSGEKIDTFVSKEVTQSKKLSLSREGEKEKTKTASEKNSLRHFFSPLLLSPMSPSSQVNASFFQQSSEETKTKRPRRRPSSSSEGNWVIRWLSC
jgi:hypothetical protein